MNPENESSEWADKGATLSDKTAQKEFDLSYQDIVDAIRSGKLQYRENNIYGNPYLRLIRREVEALVCEKFGDDYLKRKVIKKELGEVSRKLKALKTETRSLELRKVELLKLLEE